MCLVLDTAHRDDHCITVCGKWNFDPNLKLALPLTRAWLKYICSINDTYKIEFIAVLHAIRAVPPEGLKNIKYEIRVINCHQYRIHHYQHCSNIILPYQMIGQIIW